MTLAFLKVQPSKQTPQEQLLGPRVISNHTLLVLNAIKTNKRIMIFNTKIKLTY